MNNDSARQPRRDLRFFVTAPHACSYLEGRRASTLFLDPQVTPDRETYDHLTQQGFRRSGHHLYRPHCENCNACISVRIPVELFQPSRSQRKTIHRNADVTLAFLPSGFNPAHYQLYARYIQQRHADGDMYPPSPEQYRSFLGLERDYAQLLEMRLGERLIAVCAFDSLRQGLSAIYTFFDPAVELERRSLGTFAVLSLITHCRNLGLPYLYLGYWINECQKMTYKQTFRPLEQLDGRHWRPLITLG
ncbi:arginyltransferase [Halomonas halocynthiae]|uniref:arginyltransferase n=1 Tax=Halomonas halocynthiae TaxID=176290 RepID=UPI000412AA55|nr:arginyltransferase [Halomonas halocynthiae]